MNSKAAALAWVVVLSALFLLLSGPLRAQAAGTTLSGVVTGPSGAPVPNAAVSVRNVATGQSVQTQTDSAGAYTVSGLAPGEYEVSASAEGGGARTAKATVGMGGSQTLDLVLAAGGAGAAPSLSDLGFTPAEAQGSARNQALLDKRSHMLKIHQRLGLITTAPFLATIIAANGAAGRRSSASGRELHAALGGITAGLYFTTASFAIFAPKPPGTVTHGPIRLHKALAWIHGPGMVLTPILGALAYQQRSNGQRVHGIASAHGAVAAVTGVAYGAALLSVSIKF